jgi:hypothetical protein
VRPLIQHRLHADHERPQRLKFAERKQAG